MMILPTPQQLRYLLALSETGHFGRAAAACSVTQSTLSAGILALERQLDAQILDRSMGKRVLFTPLGREVLNRARTALTALEAMVEAIALERAPMAGPLRMGVIPTIGPFLLPSLMPALRQAFPRLKLYLREDTTGNLVHRLEEGRLDLLLVALPCACGNAETMVVAQDDFLVALPKGHPLAERSSVPEAALSAERMLLLEDGHCLRDHVLAACPTGLVDQGRAGDGFAATSLHTLVQMVAGGLGVTLLPRLAVKGGIAQGVDVELRPLDGRGAWRGLGLAWRSGAVRAADYRALGAVLNSVLREHDTAFSLPSPAGAHDEAELGRSSGV